MGSEEEVKSANSGMNTNTLSAKIEGILYRPNAGPALWLCCLVPISYLVSALRHQAALTDDYKMSLIIAFGLLFQSIDIFFKLNKSIRKIMGIDFITTCLPGVCTVAFISICLHHAVVHSVVVGFSATIAYNSLFYYILKHLPKSFTFGEASIILQGFVIFMVNILLKLINIVNYKPMTNMDRLSTVLQIGLLGVAFIAACCHFIKPLQGVLFYILLTFVSVIVVLFPIADNFAIVILVEFLFHDAQRVCIVFIYMGLIGLTIAATIWHVSEKRSSNTRVRKIFHILIDLAFIPGLLFQCTFLFVASGIALALLIVLEIARVIKLWPISQVLDEAVKAFVDEKDVGLIALTPIYLLVGCSIPLWLHPCPCDLTDAAGFELLPLLSGVISVGIGDTAASVIGSTIGRIKWPGSIKTVEGTIAAIVAQAIILPILIQFGFIQSSAILIGKFCAAIIINSLIETFTDQVDNLVLPLVTYIILSV